MGRSAKVHKRIPKKNQASSSATTNLATPSSCSARSQVQAAKKRSTLKGKVVKDKSSGSSGKGVLGGADYVSLLMGGRKKARDEAKKLPQEEL